MKLGLMLSILIATIAMMHVCAEDPPPKKEALYLFCSKGAFSGSSNIEEASPRPCRMLTDHVLQCYKIAYLVPPRSSPKSMPAEWIRIKGCMPPNICKLRGALNKCHYGLNDKITFPGMTYLPNRIPNTTLICCCNTTKCNSGQADLKASLPLAAALLLLTIKLSVQMYF